MIFRLSPGLIYYKDIENMKSLKAKYGHPFVYKPHNLCLEEAHVVCATTLIVDFLVAGMFIERILAVAYGGGLFSAGILQHWYFSAVGIFSAQWSYM